MRAALSAQRPLWHTLDEWHGVVLSNVGLTERIGFNASQCANELTTRGESQRSKKTTQGPLTPQCTADQSAGM